MKKLIMSGLLLPTLILSLLVAPCYASGSVSIDSAACGNPGFISVSWTSSGEDDVLVTIFSDDYFGLSPWGPFNWGGGPTGNNYGDWIYDDFYYYIEMTSSTSGFLDDAYLGC